MVITQDTYIPERLFITGIDTDAGKSFVTGLMARDIAASGRSVITQKFVQTGNVDFSEDIDVHRRIMGIDLLPEDLDHTTAPEIYSYPCSADLAAKLDNRPIDLAKITAASDTLASRYDHLLIEGAGGLMVPLNGQYLTIDYIKEHRLPVVLVTTGRLGSINHTLLSLLAIKTYGIELFALAYNQHFDADKVICDDTTAYLRAWLATHFPEALYLEFPSVK